MAGVTSKIPPPEINAFREGSGIFHALLAAIPEPDLERSRNKKLEVIRGEVTSPIDPTPGCRFAARCEYCTGRSSESNPEFVEVTPGHYVSCFLVNDK